MSELWAVYLAPDSPPVPSGLAEALASVWNIPYPDAASHARRAWGILAEQLAEPEARYLAEALKQRNIRAFVVPKSRLRRPPPARLISAISLSADGLSVTLENGQGGPLPADRIALVAAAGFAERRTTKKTVTEEPSKGTQALRLGVMMTTGLPLGGGKKKEVSKTDVAVETLFYADFFLSAPEARLRVDAQRLNYGFLGAGMAANVLQNFKTFLAQAVARTGRAARNKGCRALLANEPLAAMGYESLADLEKEETWLWTGLADAPQTD